MTNSSVLFLTLGGILLLGLLISTIAQRTVLPRVTLLVILGAVIGPHGLNLIPDVFTHYFEVIAQTTLLMVGFLLGGKLTTESLQQHTGDVFWISICAAVITTMVVSIGLIWAGVPTEIAMILGCIASATAPAAILDVTAESGSQGPFSRLLVAIVTLDDIWALVLFGIGFSLVAYLNDSVDHSGMLWSVAWEIGGAVLLGAVVGVPAAYLTGRIKPGQPILTEALAIVLICGGLALWLEVSYLITAIVTGAVVSNFASHHEYPFHAIEGIEWPFMVVFFTLAGASLDLSIAREIVVAGAVYIGCRTIGKYVGAGAGGIISQADATTKSWIGVALLPQAGVSIGMGLVAASHYPEQRQMLLSIVIGSTVFFEIIGPIFVRLALKRADG